MLWRWGTVCTGAILVFLAGCAFKYGNTDVQVGVNVKEQVVQDSVAQVSQKIEQEMRRLGLQVVVAPEGEAVRLASTTKTGQKFTVVCSRVASPQGEQTKVRIDWDQAPDEALW